MTKRYGEPIDVEAPEGSIEAFWWRGRRYGIRQVLCRWRETGEWWLDASQERPWVAGSEREILRVDAQPATNGLAPGVYEIARDMGTGRWTLFRVLD